MGYFAHTFIVFYQILHFCSCITNFKELLLKFLSGERYMLRTVKKKLKYWSLICTLSKLPAIRIPLARHVPSSLLKTGATFIQFNSIQDDTIYVSASLSGYITNNHKQPSPPQSKYTH
jgi:hypothetical protein